MKKTLLLAFTVLVGFSSYGQGPLTKKWEIKPDATSGALVGMSNLQTTIAYNKVTDKLYLPERNNKINILNPVDGTLSSPATLATLNTAPEWTGSYRYTKIRVDANGVIYACNMTLGAGTAYIYRWASEADLAPTVSAITVTARTGDSFAISGTGTGTIIYLSGSSNNDIYVCKTADGVNFTLDHKIAVSGTAGTTNARSSISAVSNSLTSDLWINTLNVEAKRITTNAAGVITATEPIVTSLINQKYSHAEYISEGTEKYLAVAGAHDAVLGLDFKLYKITDFPTPNTAVTEVGSGVLAPTAYTTNANAYADVAYKKNADETFTFFHLQANNGLAAYTTATALPVSLTSFAASFTNNQNSLAWSTASENNNAGFEIESSTDGVSFSNIGFVASKGSGNSSEVLTYSFQDKLAASGTTYYRLKQVDKNGAFTYSNVKYVNNTLSSDHAVSVHPNPTSDYVTITGADAAGVTVQLFNSNGSEINTGSLLQGNKLDMSSLNTGIYVLRILNNGVLLQTTKLVKQ